jgi:hypothetical protein
MQFLDEIGGVLDRPLSTGGVKFSIAQRALLATPIEGTNRVEISAIVGEATVGEVERWLELQPEPMTAALGDLEADEGAVTSTVVFRLWRVMIGHDWRRDRFLEELDRYVAAWNAGESAPEWDLDQLSARVEVELVPDPVGIEPANAWLTMGGDGDLLDVTDIEDAQWDADLGDYSITWTVSKQTLEGDLILMYFKNPLKQIRYVARAASAAFLDDTPIEGASFDRHQWWAYLTPPVEIEPISYAQFNELAGIVLRGRSGKYVRPDVIERLPFVPVDPDDTEQLARIVRRPVGIPDVPGTALMTTQAWREMAGGAFRKEADVTRHVVMPLIRWMVPDGATIVAEYPAGGGRADVVVLHGDLPILTVEVKLVINVPNGNWRLSPDLEQLRRYTEDLETPGLLVDANRIVVVPREYSIPDYQINRDNLAENDLNALRDLLM